MKQYNLADDNQFEHFVMGLGGEELLKKKYDGLYRILLHTRDMHRKSADKHMHLKGANLLRDQAAVSSGAGETYGLEDSMKIRTLNYDPRTTVQTGSSFSTVEESPSLVIVGSLRDVTNGRILDSFAVHDNNSHYLEKGLSVDSKSLIRSKQYEFRAESTFYRIQKDMDGKPYCDGVTLYSDKKTSASAGTLVKNIVVNAPTADMKRHPEIDRILVYYNYRKGKECDYYYDNVKTGDYEVEVHLPFSGSAEFDPYFKPASVDKNGGFMLQLENPNGGVAAFNTAHWNEISWAFHDCTVSWTFPDYWYERLRKTDYHYVNDLNFYCEIPVITQNGILVPLVISSGDGTHEDPSFKQIKRVRIEWGCFAQDTMIRMADGSEKRVQDVKTGDRVRTETGSASVTETITGTEDEIAVIMVSRGNTIRVTRDHPMLTQDGWKTVDELSAADILITEHGPDSIESLYPEVYGGRVFSFRTDNEDAILAEGFYTGDFGRQNRLPERPSEPEKPLEDFQEELADLVSEIDRKGKE